MTTTSPPQRWGKDPLTHYLEAYRSNQFATFANKGQAMKDLIRIDSLFEHLLKGAINPRPLYPMTFMLRAHSAYRAGVGAVMGGQLYESQTLLRLCLEHAAYGFYIGADKNRMERWLRRGDSDATRKAVKREFHNDKLKAYIGDAAPLLLGKYDHLYNQLMEFGAHPNEPGYSLNSTIIKVEGEIQISAIYLQENGIRLDMAIKTAAQVGLWPLLIMQLLYRERYELLGIRSDLEQLSQRY